MNRPVSLPAHGSPCAACATLCCGAFRIFLSPFDLVRLSRALELPPECICLPVQLCAENADHAPWSFSLGEEERFLIGLRRKSGHCLFLMNLSGNRRCGVHALRPLVCRSYPWRVEHRRLHRVRQWLCPTDWPLTAEERHQWCRLGPHLEREALLYQAFLETWQEDVLPKLGAEGLARLDLRGRFRRFVEFLTARVDESGE